MRLICRLPLLAMIIAMLSLHEVSAFHRTAIVKSSRAVFFRVNLPNNEGPAPSTQLSSHKFKNIEEMLDAFQEEPILVYFTSSTCGPCRLQKKELIHARELLGADPTFKVISIDTRKWPHVGTRFSIGKLPCLLYMKDKEVLLRLEGLTKAEELVEKVFSNTRIHALR